MMLIYGNSTTSKIRHGTYCTQFWCAKIALYATTCLLVSMHIKCQCQRRVHAYRLLVSMLVQMFSACMLTTYSAEMLFFRRAAAVSPPHKSLCGALLVCVVCMCGVRLVCVVCTCGARL